MLRRTLPRIKDMTMHHTPPHASWHLVSAAGTAARHMALVMVRTGSCLNDCKRTSFRHTTGSHCRSRISNLADLRIGAAVSLRCCKRAVRRWAVPEVILSTMFPFASQGHEELSVFCSASFFVAWSLCSHCLHLFTFPLRSRYQKERI